MRTRYRGTHANARVGTHVGDRMSVADFQGARVRAIILSVMVWAGCASNKRPQHPSMGSTWHDHAAASVQSDEPREVEPKRQEASLRRTATPASSQSGIEASTIAVVNGVPIPRHRVIYFLLKSRGPDVLEQLVVLDAAERMASDRGLTLSRDDVEREYDLALQQISNPLAVVTPGGFNRPRAEELLQTVLARRSLSHEEFMLGVRRNAYLRRIVESELTITEEDLRSAFADRHGPRIQIRHIQLATAAEVARVQDQLGKGEDFAELATRCSANEASAARGGLLEPFSLDDSNIPAAFRTAAGKLDESTVSHAVRVGEWYHLLNFERIVPQDELEFDDVRRELGARLRGELAGPKMRQLYQKLFQEASIEIMDPILREAFERNDPDGGS